MKAFLVLALVLLTQSAFAGEIKISSTTPVITPTDLIFVFPMVDWDKIEIRQDAGKSNRDSMVMMCDDSNYSIVEIKLDYNYNEEKSALEDVTIETDNCAFDGAYTDKFSPSWLHFSGPKDGGSCEVILQKQRPGGKSPLKMVYEIHDAC